MHVVRWIVSTGYPRRVASCGMYAQTSKVLWRVSSAAASCAPIQSCDICQTSKVLWCVSSATCAPVLFFRSFAPLLRVTFTSSAVQLANESWWYDVVLCKKKVLSLPPPYPIASTSSAVQLADESWWYDVALPQGLAPAACMDK